MLEEISIPAKIVFVLAALAAVVQFAFVVTAEPAFAFGLLVGGVVGAVVWAGLTELAVRALSGLYRRVRGGSDEQTT
jgi:hypothetical protein